MKCICVIVLCYVTVIVVTDALPHSSANHIRNKRGFRQAIVDRIGHGFGKRTDPVFDNYLQDYPEDEYMSSNELVQYIMTSQAVAEAVVSRFIDRNGDGKISTEELLGKSDV